MCLRDEKGIGARLLRMLVTIVALSSGCAAKEPLSVDEVLNVDALVPIHYLDTDSNTSYRELDTIYYYYGDSSEAQLVTYFVIENSEDEVVRVARMLTCNYCGQLVQPDEVEGGPAVPIVWASDGEGSTCKVLPRAYRNDHITGDPFQSCMFWLDKDLNEYKLYTVWPESKAVDFANSLSVLNEEGE